MGRSANRRSRRQPQPAFPSQNIPMQVPNLGAANQKMDLREPAYLPGPLADPHWVSERGPSHLQLIAIGGETKLYKLSCEVTKELVSCCTPEDLAANKEKCALIADAAVNVATALFERLAQTQGKTDGQPGEDAADAPDQADPPPEEGGQIVT